MMRVVSSLIDVAFSPYVIVVAAGWFFAHILKYLVLLSKGGRHAGIREVMLISGGMPSSHSSIVAALWMLIFLKDGAESGLLGVATALAVIVCYDAVSVRRASGEQGEAIKSIVNKANLKVEVPKLVKGHTLIEMIAGVATGLVIGAVVFIATN